MNGIKLSLLICFTFPFNLSYSQDCESLGEKETAIEIIKDNYLFMYFRHPVDTVTTLNRFVETIDRIAPVSNIKKDRIKRQALSSIRQDTNKMNVSDQIDSLPLSGINFIPLLGANVNDVIINNFSEEGYAVICKAMFEDRFMATKAYYFLEMIHWTNVIRKTGNLDYPKEVPIEIYCKYRLDSIYDYFGID